MCTTSISLGIDDKCRHAFGLKQEGHRRWTPDRSRVNWEEFVHCQVRVNETYSEAKRQFSDRNRDCSYECQVLSEEVVRS